MVPRQVSFSEATAGVPVVARHEYVDLHAAVLVVPGTSSNAEEVQKDWDEQVSGSPESLQLMVLPYASRDVNIPYASAELSPASSTDDIPEGMGCGDPSKVWQLRAVSVRPLSVGAEVKPMDARDGVLVAVVQELFLAADRYGITHCTVDEGARELLEEREFPLAPLTGNPRNAGDSRSWVAIEDLRNIAQARGSRFFATFAACMEQQPLADQPWFPASRQEVKRGIEHRMTDVGPSVVRWLMNNCRKTLGRLITRASMPTPIARFYDESGAPIGEAHRLDTMARRADPLSIKALGEYAKPGNYIIADIGAGDSTSFAFNLKELNELVQYWPIDKRDDAVAAQRRAGWPAQKGSAFGIPYEDASVDAAHARFVFGWLGGKDNIKAAIGEMLRVVGRTSDEARSDLSLPPRLAILDYDWTVTKGPKPLQTLIQEVSAWVQGEGFNPEFGATMKADITAALEACRLSGTDYNMTVTRNNSIGPFFAALDTIRDHVTPLMNMLREKHLDSEVAKLEQMLWDVEKYAQRHPDEEIRLPDIVSTTIDLTNTQAHKEAVARILAERTEKERLHAMRGLVPVNPVDLETYILPKDMIGQARANHAASYKRYLTEEALEPDGTLIDDIDPHEVVKRSVYLGQVNSSGLVTAQIRLIEHGEEPVTALPTVGKIDELLQAQGMRWEDLGLPFDIHKARIFEGSALGKTPHSKNASATLELFIAAILEAERRGYDYAVTGFVERVASLIPRTYGTKAFTRIGDDRLKIKLDGKGMRPEGVMLVPFYTSASSKTFLNDLLDPSNRLSSDDVALIKRVQKRLKQQS